MVHHILQHQHQRFQIRESCDVFLYQRHAIQAIVLYVLYGNVQAFLQELLRANHLQDRNGSSWDILGLLDEWGFLYDSNLNSIFFSKINYLQNILNGFQQRQAVIGLVVLKRVLDLHHEVDVRMRQAELRRERSICLYLKREELKKFTVEFRLQYSQESMKKWSQ